MYRRIISGVSEYFNTVGTYILGVMMFLTTVDVVGRYFFHAPLIGSYEITEFLMAIVLFLGLAFTQIRKSHISIEMFLNKLPGPYQAAVNFTGYLLAAMMFAFVAWQTAIQANLFRMNAQVSSTLSIPIWPFVAIASIGSALFFLVLLVDVYDSLAKVIEKRCWDGLAVGLFVVLALSVIAIRGQQPPFMMSAAAIGVFCVVLMLVLLLSGMLVGMVMGIVGLVGTVYLVGLGPGLTLMGTVPYTQSANYTMSVVPLFILMGMFASYSGLSEDLYAAGYKWLGRLPGGLAIASVAAAAGFSAVCGSTTATAATVAVVALPEMKKYGYDDALATGVVTAGGTLGILIPPSIILAIYGMLTETSIGKLFIAGIVPGVILAIFYMATVYISCKLNPSLGPAGAKTTFKEKVISLKGAWQVVLLFGLVMGGIYGGMFTANEAAGIGAFGALVIALLLRKVTWKNFRQSLLEAGVVNAMTLFTLIGAMVFGYFLALSRLPYELATAITGLGVNRYVILTAVILVYLVLGCFMSSMAMIIITLPVFFPMILSAGFDPIWFGILIVLMAEIGVITPPYGINVFVVKGIAKEVSTGTIFRGVMPFVIADLVFVILLVLVPQMATWLPGLMS